MEKKRRSRAQRDRLTTNKPGHPYQKNHPPPRKNPPATQPASPDLSGRSPSRYRDPSTVNVNPSYLDLLPPGIPSEEQRSLYSSAALPSRSSPTSSFCHLNAGTSSPPEPRNLSPPRAPSPTLTPAFDHYRCMALTPQPTPNSFFPMSVSHHGSRDYSQNLLGQFRVHNSMLHPIPADGCRAGTQSTGVYGPNHPRQSGCDEYQGRTLMSPRSFVPHSSDVLAPCSPHFPEQLNTPCSLPHMLHGFGIPSVNNAGGGGVYLGDEDRANGTSLQDAYLLPDRSSGVDSPSDPQYYS